MAQMMELVGREPTRRMAKWNWLSADLSWRSHMRSQISGQVMRRTSRRPKSKIITNSEIISKASQISFGKPGIPRKKKIVKKLYVWIPRIILLHT